MSKNISCPNCDKQFKTLSGLTWHQQHIHNQSQHESAYLSDSVPDRDASKSDQIDIAS